MRISESSTLAVSGRHVRIDSLELDGALEIHVAEGASLHIRWEAQRITFARPAPAAAMACPHGCPFALGLIRRSLNVRNDGWRFDELAPQIMEDSRCPEILRMRGYTLRKREVRANHSARKSWHGRSQSRFLPACRHARSMSPRRAHTK